jgi:pSer/pThr/pTyr-binding forkhead associated (FHA) protein
MGQAQFLFSFSKELKVVKRSIVGRTEGDFILKDKKLSSKHCELIPRGLNLAIMDLQSTNGVFINGN